MEIAAVKKREAIKIATRRAILSVIRRKAPISRKDIIALVRIRPTTVSDMTRELIRDGIVQETGRAGGEYGRKQVLLGLNANSRIALGVHYSGNCARIVAVDVLGKVKFQTRKVIRMSSRRSFIADTQEAIAEAVRATGKKPKDMMGIGLGTPGLVDRQHGISRYHTGYGWWKNIPLKDAVEDKFGIPAFVENDTRTLTMAERWFGCGKGVRNMIYIDIGDGVSAGLVLNGGIYYGAAGIAGELGHTVIDPMGLLCDCGRHGCLETVFSLKVLKRNLQDELKWISPPNDENIIAETKKLARSGNRRTIALLDHMGRYLSIVVVNLANLFNPELIVVGGAMGTAFGEWLMEKVTQAVRTQALKTESHGIHIHIMFSRLDEYGGALGAASMALESWFDLE